MRSRAHANGIWLAAGYHFYAVHTCFSGLWNDGGTEYTPLRMLLAEYDEVLKSMRQKLGR